MDIVRASEIYLSAAKKGILKEGQAPIAETPVIDPKMIGASRALLQQIDELYKLTDSIILSAKAYNAYNLSIQRPDSKNAVTKIRDFGRQLVSVIGSGNVLESKNLLAVLTQAWNNFDTTYFLPYMNSLQQKGYYPNWKNLDDMKKKIMNSLYLMNKM